MIIFSIQVFHRKGRVDDKNHKIDISKKRWYVSSIVSGPENLQSHLGSLLWPSFHHPYQWSGKSWGKVRSLHRKGILHPGPPWTQASYPRSASSALGFLPRGCDTRAKGDSLGSVHNERFSCKGRYTSGEDSQDSGIRRISLGARNLSIGDCFISKTGSEKNANKGGTSKGSRDFTIPNLGPEWSPKQEKLS